MRRSFTVLLSMIAAVLPATDAAAAPTIAFLNPSGFATTPPTISDVQDADGRVHLVAWASEAPAQALVEFELQPAGQDAATFTAERVGSDTWEALVPIPDSYADGANYTLRARLYRGVPGDAEEVANAEMAVEVDQSEIPPPRGETVELSYPANGDRLGIFVPKGKRPVGVFDYTVSDGTEQVRSFYTTSQPGDAPVWQECGSSAPGTDGFGKVRCTLREGHDPLDVAAVAVVSNKTSPPAPPNPALDDSADAHRVRPYLQQPETVDVADGNRTVDLATCHLMRAVVSDQFGRPVAAANVDVHADGPEDQLDFGTVVDQTDAFRPPDSEHASRENAKRCSDNQDVGEQGDHNTPGRDDTKHVESVDGTSSSGVFRFALRSDFAGGTFVQAWADVDDDDLPDQREASGGTQLGWGTPPPEPRFEVFLTPERDDGVTGSCVAFEILARRSGGPHTNGNVDIHLSGPDQSVAFCDPPGGGTIRPPESGGHLGGAHEDGTRHGEGEADTAGRLVFGVTSGSTGGTRVQVWVDRTEDDSLNDEPSRTGTVTWYPPGKREISIDSNRSSVASGRRVRLFGEIGGDPSCSREQSVDIQSKPVRRGRFGTIRTVTTRADGTYVAAIRMQSSRKFRAVAPAETPCSFARSDTITVQVRR